MIALIIILVILIIIITIIYGFKRRFSAFLFKYFGTTDFKSALEKSEIEASETPKSISSMEPLLLSRIKTDFPELNINEIKSMAENAIINCLEAIEKKELSKEYESNKVNSWINSNINDTKDKNAHFDSIKFHRSAISSYEHKDGIVSMYINTSVEYYYGDDETRTKKVQDRFKCEFVYIIDSSNSVLSKTGLGLNCPNCGAPIKNLGNKKCVYCGSFVKEFVKRTWYLNNIERF